MTYNLIILVLTLIIFVICYYYSRKRKIDNIREIVLPTIINEQSYYFVKTNYSNISFIQLIKSKDYISDSIKKQGKWPECQEIFNIYKTGKRNGIFIDFGANIGSCSFLFAQAGVRVFAFEPLPNNLFQFSLTTFLNSNFSKYITIFPYALGRKDTKQIMKISKNNWSYSSLYYNHSDYSEEITVKKLDDFEDLIPTKISMIKIDVEGGEYDLIAGGKHFFKTHKTEFIHMEATCGRIDENGKYEIEKLFSILKKMGYEIIQKFDCKIIEKSNIVAKLIFF